MTRIKKPRCLRCRRRWRNQTDWIVLHSHEDTHGIVCTDCTTPEEQAEVLIRKVYEQPEPTSQETP